MQAHPVIKKAIAALVFTIAFFTSAWSMDTPMIWTSNWDPSIRGTKAAVISGTCTSLQDWFVRTYPSDQYQEFMIKGCHALGESYIAPYYTVEIRLEFKRTTYDGQGNVKEVWESHNTSGAYSAGMTCQPPLHYNASTQTCETRCPAGQAFNPDSRGCSGKEQPQCESHTAHPIDIKNGVKKRREVDWEGEGHYPLRFIRYYHSMGNLRREWSGYGPDPTVSERATQTGNINVLNGAAGISGPGNVYSEAPVSLSQAQQAQPYPFDSPPHAIWDKKTGYIGHADRKWRHNHDYYLYIQRSDGNQIIAYRPDGTDIPFKNLHAQLPVPVRLSRLPATDPIAPNGYLYTAETLNREYYDTQGRILKIINRDGFAHTYAYDSQNPALLRSVTDSSGAIMAFAYDAQNRLAEMTTPDGQIYRYTHHPDNGLYSAVIYPDNTPSNPNDNPGREYLYEDPRFPGALTGIRDDGIRYATFSYDHNGRAIMSELDGGVERVAIEYTDNDTRVLQNALGKETRYEFVNANGSLLLHEILGAASSNCAATTERMIYDAQNRKKQTVARDGTVTDYGYNSLNQLSTLTEAFGTSEARTTTYSYDSQGRKIADNFPGQTPINYALDSQGRVIEISRGYQKTRFTYTAQGQVLSIDGPQYGSADTLNYQYDAQGRLTRITDASGNITHITAYDAAHRPLTVIDPNGVRSDYRYHPRGWLASVTVAGETTQFDYTTTGKLTQLTQPNGDTTGYEYNAAQQLTAIQDSDGNRIEYTRDLLGNIITTLYRDPQGHITYRRRQDYDELGRLLQAHGENGQLSRYSYDLNDNPVQETNALNQTTLHLHDRFNRRTQHTDALNGLTRYQYNAADWLTKVTDPKGHATLYYYNYEGKLTSLNSPNTGNENWTYDLWSGHLTQYWGHGQYWYYTWDAANRLTQHKMGGAGSAEDRYYTYDETEGGNHGKTRLTKLRDGSGEIRYHYDAKGRITQLSQRIAAHTYTLAYQYDTAGRVTRMTYPGGEHLLYTYAGGQLSTLEWQTGAHTQPLASHLHSLPFGPLGALTYGNGLTLTRNLDTDYRLVGQTLGSLENKTYRYTLTNQITDIQDGFNPLNDTDYNYDALSRLTQAQNTHTHHYSYDPVGNRLGATLNNANTSYSYKTTNQHLTQAGAETVQHDSYGRILQKGLWTYAYNYYNHRLKEVRYQNQLKGSYVYNALGQRTRKILPGGGETHYVYDLDGQLIAEADQNGTLRRYYIYLHREPLALIENGNVYYYHNDHLGTPQKITDPLQQVVWQADYEPFGKATVPIQTINNPLRFPGQYFDQESGLHYNWHRYYDPTTGRYITSDPIGLAGGINTYAYVGNNPISFSDPNGLWANVAVGIGVRVVGGRTAATAIGAAARQYGLPGMAAACVLAGICTFNEAANDDNPSGEQCPNENTNPYQGPVDTPVIVVDGNGNAIPVNEGESITSSPDGDYQQVRDSNGNPTGTRYDRGGHRNHSNPNARGPHAHVPEVTLPSGDPHLPLM